MRRLAATLDAIRSTRSKNEKVAHLATLLASLSREELPIAARLILGQPRVLGVGWGLLAAAASQVTRRSEGEIGLKTRELGDFGDALKELLPASAPSLPLIELPGYIERLAATNDREDKQRILVELLGRTTPAEVRYVAKALLGELRIGLQRGLFDEAVAQAFGAPIDEVRRASALTPDPGELALLARDGKLSTASISLGQVVSFMLATPTEQVKEPIDPALTVVEDKIDGVRTQAHVAGGVVRLFARGYQEVTAQFPEVAQALARLQGPTVLDGEIFATGPGGRPRPFQALQARLNRVRASASVRAEVPVAFVAWDVLVDGEVLLDRPWTERRRRLEALQVPVNPVTTLDPGKPVAPQLDDLFTQARARGHEGLVLKRIDAPYEAGRRGSAWRKVKRAYATLDVVITRAERGHGKRASVLSDYTFAVWRGETLVEIGKAYSGLTDPEIAALTRRLEAITVSVVAPLSPASPGDPASGPRSAPGSVVAPLSPASPGDPASGPRSAPVQQRGLCHLVRPEIVLEVAFDGLQRSTRHDSGFALRFPRIARIRDDKKPHEADRLETVKALFQAQLESGHREEAKQLDLFG